VSIQKRIEEYPKINDPRRQYGYLQHKLVTILVIAFCGIICGGEDYEGIEAFGKARKGWLARFLNLENSTPDQRCVQTRI
jgi:hypothetical protein